VDAEIAQARVRYADDPKTIAYFESDRGRSFIRSTLRRTRTVETLVDGWLAAHPDHPALPHVEENGPSAPADASTGLSSVLLAEAEAAADTDDPVPAADLA
jgi:hypothetical protein